MTRKATSFTHSSTLIDDYLLIAKPPVANDLGGRFVAVENSAGEESVTELLAVGSDETSVIHFFRDKHSHSGWNNATVPLPMVLPAPIDKLVGFYEAGALNVLVFCKGSASGNAVTWMVQAAGYWSEFKPDGAMAEVLASTTEVDTYRGPEGNHVIYGLADSGSQPQFFLISRDPSSDTWDVNLQMAATSAASPFLVVAGEGANQLTILQGEGSSITFRGGSIVNGAFQWEAGSEWQNVHLNAGDLTLNQFYGLPAAKGQGAFLLRANNSELYYVSDFSGASPNSQDLTAVGVAPTGVSAICAGVDKNGLYMLFALDTANQNLWLLRQTGVDAFGNAVFAPNWVQLGNALSVIACPTAMASGPEVFAVNPAADVLHLFEKLAVEPSAPAYGSWFTETVDGPTPAGQDPVSVFTYTTEIVLVDDNGSPVPSVMVKIKADRHTVIIANELAHHIGPDTPAKVSTTKLGKLTIAIKATTLTAPLLYISTKPDLWKPCPSDAGVFDKLADKSFTTVDSMNSAHLLPSSYKDPTALAKSIQTTGQLLVQKRSSQTKDITTTCGATPSAPFDLSKLAMPHYEIDFTTPGGPTVYPLPADEAKARILDACPGEPTLSFKEFWGDVANFFKHAFKDIKKFIHYVEEQVVHIAIHAFHEVKCFILRTVDDIGDMLEVLFHWIALGFDKVVHAIKNAIKWLSYVFDWEDIVNTHKVVRNYVNGAMTHVQKSIPQAQNYVNKEFATLEGKINTFFKQLVKDLDGGESFTTFVSKRTKNPKPALQGSKYHQAFHSNSAACNYAYSKAQNHLSNSTSLSGLLAASPGSSSFDDFTGLINKHTDGFKSSGQSVKSHMLAQKDAPKNFLDSVIVDFLTAAKDIIDFILGFVDTATISLLGGLDAAITALHDALTTPIDIPIISWLYKKIAGDPLTILDLLCLIIAIPMTILHDILYGKPPFSKTPSDPNYYQNFTGAIPWPSADSLANPAETPGMDGAADLSSVQSILVPLGGVSYFLYMILDVFGDALSVVSEDDEPDPLAYFLSVSNIVTSLMFMAFTVPYQAMEKKPDQWSEADKATVTAWAVSFLPIVLNLYFCIESIAKADSRFSKPIGQISLSMYGAILLGVSIWATVAQNSDKDYENGWNEAANIISPIPTVCAFLPIFDEETDDLTLVILLAIAAVCDVGTMVSIIAGAMEEG